MGKLDGKVAVITGGSAGMGLATAKLFTHEGARVVITGRDQAALDAAARDVGDGVEAFRCDISTVADLEALRVHVGERYGRVDVLLPTRVAEGPDSSSMCRKTISTSPLTPTLRAPSSRCRSSSR